MSIGADISARYTEEAVGGGHPTKARVIDRLALAALFPDGKIRANRQPIECAGRLDYVNETTLAFRPALRSPYYPAVANPTAGRHVPFIDAASGDVYYEDLPWAGITITNQGLAANASYSVFVHDDGRARRLEFHPAASWTFDPATGLPHRTGDRRRTFVGVARTNGAARFSLTNNVLIRSFWNKAEYAAESTGQLATTRSTTWASISTQEILMWPGHDVVRQKASGNGWVSSNQTAGLVGLDMGLRLFNGTGQGYPETEIIGSSSNEKDSFGMAKTQVHTGAFSRVHSTFVFRVKRTATLSVGDYLFQSIILI